MTDPITQTRNSLLLRLPDTADVDAWDQFVAIYQPLIFRLARAKGFQEADAHDIVQEVLIAVSKSIHRWDNDPAKGRFRDWLCTVARNLMINFLTRRKHLPLGQGGSDLLRTLHHCPDPTTDDGEASAEFDWEYRRELYVLAAKQVRHEVLPKTWSAFQRTALEGATSEEVARELGMQKGSVVVARCRVLARLREAVKRLEDRE